MIELDSHADYYLLSEDELKLLLGGMGFSKFYAAFKENKSDEIVLQENLIKLYSSNIVKESAEGFEIHPRLKEIVLSIGNAKVIKKLSISQSGETIWIYCGKKDILCVFGRNDSRILRLGFLKDNYLFEKLEDALKKSKSKANLDELELLWIKDETIAEMEVYENGTLSAKFSLLLEAGGKLFSKSIVPEKDAFEITIDEFLEL